MALNLFVNETVGSTFKVCSDVVQLMTKERLQFIDLTELVRERVRRSEVAHGLVNVHTKHTTTGLVVNENEPLLLSDFKDFVERWHPAAPPIVTTTCKPGDFRFRPTNGPTAIRTPELFCSACRWASTSRTERFTSVSSKGSFS